MTHAHAKSPSALYSVTQIRQPFAFVSVKKDPRAMPFPETLTKRELLNIPFPCQNPLTTRNEIYFAIAPSCPSHPPGYHTSGAYSVVQVLPTDSVMPLLTLFYTGHRMLLAQRWRPRPMPPGSSISPDASSSSTLHDLMAGIFDLAFKKTRD
ncbi:hypothetical protein M422DRAFT_248237 [Sphaerobolus stellatus SS14]|uniref:Uncharacterized protein n=1 Tax=Sphaerobolus stellatus (strain SS14) TaxID=990650 RepID=A0A0C9W4Z1_SPHS4|nr:hypothetical protein M422DRAFT_248237 [Sphaerobolus stellatus SS14]